MIFQKLQTIRRVMQDKGVTEMTVHDFLNLRPFEEAPSTWLNRFALTWFPERLAGNLRKANERMFLTLGIRPVIEGGPLVRGGTKADLKRLKFVLLDTEGTPTKQKTTNKKGSKK